MTARFFVGPYKAAFRYALGFKFDFLFVCKEDTYLVPERLLAAFQSAKLSCIYRSRDLLDNEPQWVGSTALEHAGYAHGGAGFFLSRNLVNYLAEAEAEPDMNDDAWCGKYARNLVRLFSTGLLQGGICPAPDNTVATCGGVDLEAAHWHFRGLRTARKRLKLIAGIESRVDILPHFLAYYRALGVEQFILGVWRGPKNPHWKQLKQLPGDVIVEPSFYDEEFCGPRDSQAQNSLRIKYVAPDEWCVYADLDEFIRVPGCDDLGALVRAAEGEGAHLVCGDFVDRLTEDGTIPARIADDLEAQFPRRAQVTKLIVGGNTAKMVMARGPVEIPNGHHEAHRHLRAFTKRAEVHHFKWYGENLIELLEQRARHYAALKLPWAHEPMRAVEHIRQHGRIVI